MRIGLVGKYINLPDAYLSVVEALKHGGYACGAQVAIDWIAADDAEGLLAEGRLHDLDGIVVPGGFGFRGIEGKIAAAGYAREHDVPFLGLCLGLHCAVIEFARDVCGLAGANSREFDPQHARTRSSTSWTSRSDVVDMGGTMRLGAYPAKLLPGTIVPRGLRRRGRLRAPPPPLRGEQPVPRSARGARAWCCSGTSPDDRLVEFVELPPTCTRSSSRTQAHPEFKSRPDRPHPLFAAFVEAST